MAIKVGNIAAFDQNPNIGIGLSIPFQNGASNGNDPVFATNYTTPLQIKYNLINYFLTRKGERVFNPSFGSIINDLVFEPNDPSLIEVIQKSIEEDIQSFFPVIKLKKVSVIPDFDNHIITSQIFYSVFSSLNEEVEFNIPL
tara:strand:+ start:83 stop:508 length:426 start_codon:yes stop_codon:yes gene_type:complete